MLKKKYNLNKQLVVKQAYQENHLERLLLQSFKENHKINPINRLSFFCQEESLLNIWNYFCSYQKLQCLVTLSSKVSSKNYHYSRFFLNKQLNKLVISNTLK